MAKTVEWQHQGGIMEIPVRAHELSPECRECIRLGNGIDAFPKFEPVPTVAQ